MDILEVDDMGLAQSPQKSAKKKGRKMSKKQNFIDEVSNPSTNRSKTKSKGSKTSRKNKKLASTNRPNGLIRKPNNKSKSHISSRYKDDFLMTVPLIPVEKVSKSSKDSKDGHVPGSNDTTEIGSHVDVRLDEDLEVQV